MVPSILVRTVTTKSLSHQTKDFSINSLYLSALGVEGHGTQHAKKWVILGGYWRSASPPPLFIQNPREVVREAGAQWHPLQFAQTHDPFRPGGDLLESGGGRETQNADEIPRFLQISPQAG